jgi:hypothetical protein
MDFSLRYDVQTASGADPDSNAISTGKLVTREMKHSELEDDDDSSPPTAEDKNVWSFTSTSSIQLHGVVLLSFVRYKLTNSALPLNWLEHDDGHHFVTCLL